MKDYCQQKCWQLLGNMNTLFLNRCDQGAWKSRQCCWEKVQETPDGAAAPGGSSTPLHLHIPPFPKRRSAVLDLYVSVAQDRVSLYGGYKGKGWDAHSSGPSNLVLLRITSSFPPFYQTWSLGF